MKRIDIKALSVNDAYRGRRFATPELKQFKKDLSLILPKIILPEGKLEVWYRFGVSSKMSDGDNLQKAFQDCLSNKYSFNDRVIYRWHGEKVDVQIGKEFIEFRIEAFS